jgi:hypothetical protein
VCERRGDRNESNRSVAQELSFLETLQGVDQVAAGPANPLKSLFEGSGGASHESSLFDGERLPHLQTPARTTAPARRVSRVSRTVKSELVFADLCLEFADLSGGVPARVKLSANTPDPVKNRSSRREI